MWVPNFPTAVLGAVAVTASAVCLYKDAKSGPPFDRKTRAEGHVVIVTGATSGIGREAAWEFAQRGAKVFMACRDMKKCEKERRDIVLDTDNKYVYCRPCDMASLDSVREFAARFKKEEPYCDVLVNNAGVMENERKITKDGFEMHLGTNHLGHFLLTNLLLDVVKASEPSRIIIVSSKAHKSGKIHADDLNLENGKFDPAAAYNQSKLANMLFGLELGRRLLESDVAVSIVDPELTDTNLTRNLPMSKSISRYVIYPLFWPTMKSAKMGAQVVVHAALDPELQKSKGNYYVSMQKADPSENALDFEVAQWLWKVSEKWTRLDDHKNLLAEALNATTT